jgi:hypothetical protein
MKGFDYTKIEFCRVSSSQPVPLAQRGTALLIGFLSWSIRTSKVWSLQDFQAESLTGGRSEFKLLTLDSTLAANRLGWHPIFSQKTVVDMTASWWTETLKFNNAFDITQKQIKDALTCITTNDVSI